MSFNYLGLRELIRKEFIQLFREKKNRPLLIVAPVLQLIVFGYVVNTDVKDLHGTHLKEPYSFSFVTEPE